MGVTAEGKLNGIHVDYYDDFGCVDNESIAVLMHRYVDSGKSHTPWSCASTFVCVFQIYA